MSSDEPPFISGQTLMDEWMKGERMSVICNRYGLTASEVRDILTEFGYPEPQPQKGIRKRER